MDIAAFVRDNRPAIDAGSPGMSTFERATLDACILLSLSVARNTGAPTKADCILLDAYHHLMRSIGRE